MVRVACIGVQGISRSLASKRTMGTGGEAEGGSWSLRRNKLNGIYSHNPALSCFWSHIHTEVAINMLQLSTYLPLQSGVAWKLTSPKWLQQTNNAFMSGELQQGEIPYQATTFHDNFDVLIAHWFSYERWSVGEVSGLEKTLTYRSIVTLHLISCCIDYFFVAVSTISTSPKTY